MGGVWHLMFKSSTYPSPNDCTEQLRQRPQFYLAARTPPTSLSPHSPSPWPLFFLVEEGWVGIILSLRVGVKPADLSFLWGDFSALSALSRVTADFRKAQCSQQVMSLDAQLA